MPQSHVDYLQEINSRFDEMLKVISEQRALRRIVKARNQRAQAHRAKELSPGPLVIASKHCDNFITVCTLLNEPVTKPIHTCRARIAKIRVGQMFANNIWELTEYLRTLKPSELRMIAPQLDMMQQLADDMSSIDQPQPI